jgi:nitrogen fixation protein FixH
MIRELKGWHVLLITLAFFGVTIGVNIVMATYAITTFSGEDTPNSYAAGVAYNKTLAAHAAQRQLGWTAVIDLEPESQGRQALDVTIKDANAQPLTGLTVEVTFRRPTDAHLDRSVPLVRAADGKYAGEVAALAPGLWDVIARTHDAAGTPFEATRRVVVQ